PRLAGQDLDEPPVGRLVRGAPDVLRMELGRVVGGERGLDPALRLGRVAGLERSFRRQDHTCARALCRERGRETRGPAPDNEDVESHERGFYRLMPAIMKRNTKDLRSPRPGNRSQTASAGSYGRTASGT